LLFNYSLYSHPEIGNFRVWHHVHKFLQLWVACLGVGEYLANEVHWPLYLLRALGLFSLDHRSRADHLGCCWDVQKHGLFHGRSIQYQRTLKVVFEWVECLLHLGGQREVVGLLH
jgi:hypothetical protein